VRLAVHRVVEVLRVLAVDRDERQVAQVDSSGRFRGIHFGSIRLRFAYGFARELFRQIEARDGGFAGELDGLIRIETLHDARLRTRALPRVTRDGRDHPIAVFRIA
jgi:hypothetical protein